MCALWQRFGRAARDRDLEAVAIFLVEAKFFDEEREKAKMRKQIREDKKRKRDKNQENRGRTTHQAATTSSASIAASVIAPEISIAEVEEDLEMRDGSTLR